MNRWKNLIEEVAPIIIEGLQISNNIELALMYLPSEEKIKKEDVGALQDLVSTYGLSCFIAALEFVGMGTELDLIERRTEEAIIRQEDLKRDCFVRNADSILLLKAAVEVDPYVESPELEWKVGTEINRHYDFFTIYENKKGKQIPLSKPINDFDEARRELYKVRKQSPNAGILGTKVLIPEDSNGEDQ